MELERLRTTLKQVSDGGLRTVFAAGEPGIGKTRLCSEFARLAYEDGAVVLYGRSDEEPLVPYQPFVEALRRWSAALTPEERASVPRADYLAPLVSELAATAKAAPAEDPEVARYKFFEAVASALEHAALAGPVVLILDDLHWADRPTLQLLQHVIRTRASSPIVLLGTYRETDLVRTRPLAESMADFRRERGFERLALPGLAEDEILQLLERAASHDVGGTGRELARALSETTDGNPFFIEQILGNLFETGRLVLRDGRWSLDAKVEDLGIPEGVIEAIGRRLSRLSDECNKVLAAASVLGRDFEVDVLTRVMEQDPDEVLGAIEEAIDVGLVREVPTRSRAACTFSHALVQQALYEELSLARKQRLHLKAANAIEQAHSSEIDLHVTTLARHLREAGAAADSEKTIDYSVRAMKSTARMLAFEEGLNHGEAALELIEESGGNEALSAGIHESLGDMRYVATADHDRGLADYQASLKSFESLNEMEKVARVHIKLGRGLSTFPANSDINLAFQHLHAAQDILGPEPDTRFAGPLAMGLATASAYIGDFKSCSANAHKGMEIGKAQGNESMWANAAAFEGWSLVETGRVDEGAELLERAWEVADRLDNVLTGFAAAWIRLAGYEMDPREHSGLALREVEKPRQAQAPNTRRALAGTIGGALAMAGDLQEAEKLLGGRLNVDVGPGGMYFASSFEIELREEIEQLDDLKNRGHAWIYARARPLMTGVVQWASGELDDARKTFEAGANSTTNQSVSTKLVSLTGLAIVEASQEQARKALELVSRADELVAAGNGWRGFLGQVEKARGAAAVAQGALADAERIFTTTLDIFERHSLPFDAAQTFIIWGRGLVDTDPRAALDKFDKALEIFVSRGAGQAWTEWARAERDRVG